MTADAERLQILKMVEKGQITAQEGARLLGALSGSAAGHGARGFRQAVLVSRARDGYTHGSPQG